MSKLRIAVHYGHKKNNDGSKSKVDRTYIRGINHDIGTAIREFAEKNSGLVGWLTLTLDGNSINKTLDSENKEG